MNLMKSYSLENKMQYQPFINIIDPNFANNHLIFSLNGEIPMSYRNEDQHLHIRTNKNRMLIGYKFGEYKYSIGDWNYTITVHANMMSIVLSNVQVAKPYMYRYFDNGMFQSFNNLNGVWRAADSRSMTDFFRVVYGVDPIKGL